MESSLTKMELDAILQLIQLSSASSSSDVVRANFPAGKCEESGDYRGEAAGSVGESFTSTAIVNPASCEEEEREEEEPLPRRKPRFGSLRDVCRRSRPLINRRAKKIARCWILLLFFFSFFFFLSFADLVNNVLLILNTASFFLLTFKYICFLFARYFL